MLTRCLDASYLNFIAASSYCLSHFERPQKIIMLWIRSLLYFFFIRAYILKIYEQENERENEILAHVCSKFMASVLKKTHVFVGFFVCIVH